MEDGFGAAPERRDLKFSRGDREHGLHAARSRVENQKTFSS
jgi:hypothetical protein